MGDLLKKTSLFIVFLKGFRFFFALGENPIKEYDRKYRGRNDADNIANDWQNVGNDIRNAYEKYKASRDGSIQGAY